MFIAFQLHGIEGIELDDGEDLLIRDDAQSFADACLELLKDTARCQRLGPKAYAKVTHRYNRAAIIKSIQQYTISVDRHPELSIQCN